MKMVNWTTTYLTNLLLIRFLFPAFMDDFYTTSYASPSCNGINIVDMEMVLDEATGEVIPLTKDALTSNEGNNKLTVSIFLT